MSAPTLLASKDKYTPLNEQKELPLAAELSGSEVVFRSYVQIGLAATVALSAVCIALTLPQGVVDPVGCLAFGYVFFVFCFQNYFLEWPAVPPKVLLLLVSALAALLAPSGLAVLGAGELVFARCGLWLLDLALMAACYRLMVRGPAYADLGDDGLEGKTYVITGCNTGIGYETARALALAGATVVFACRSEDKARAAMKKLVEESDEDIEEEQLIFLPLDVSSNASVRRFAEKFAETGLTPEALILNAGVMLSSRSLSVDGLEMTMASNHFGHFLLVQLLLPSLLAAEAQGHQPRIVVVGSNMSYLHDGFDFSEVVQVSGDAEKEAFMQKPYELFRAYGQSKLANLHFVTELARRLKKKGSKIPVNQIHPGEVLTEVMRDMHPVIVTLQSIFKPVAYGFLKSPSQGSFCTVHVATARELATREQAAGKHFVRLTPAPLSKAGRDKEVAARLWEISEKVTGVSDACV